MATVKDLAAYVCDKLAGKVLIHRYDAYSTNSVYCGEWALNRPNGIVYTASGAEAVQGVTIAADWSIYPPGTVLFVEGLGEMIVQDRGGAIQGQKIDVYFESHADARQFGRQNVRFYIVND